MRPAARRWGHALTVVALMAAVAGCRGDEQRTAPAASVTTGTAPAAGPASPAAAVVVPIDAQAFVALADQRCARTFIELEAVDYPADDSLESAATPFREVARINREQLQDLRAISPPAGDEARIGDLLQTASAGVDALDALVLAAGAGDLTAYDRALAEIEQRAQETYQQASAYGFATCFTPP